MLKSCHEIYLNVASLIASEQNDSSFIWVKDISPCHCQILDENESPFPLFSLGTSMEM